MNVSLFKILFVDFTRYCLSCNEKLDLFVSYKGETVLICNNSECIDMNETPI